MSKALDALGAEPDPADLQLEDSLRRALAVGRPFSASGEAALEAASQVKKEAGQVGNMVGEAIHSIGGRIEKQ